ncbi:MAG: SRPBCC family protein [Dehalococcoidales bacterium]|nr:SRPBCC family protein [Dehalococcoidales bacterium]
MKFSASVEINATPEKAWTLVNNAEDWPRWIPSLKKIEKVSQGPLGVGSQVRVIAKSAVTVNLLMTITEFVPGRRGVMEGKVLGTKMTRYYELEPISQVKAKLTAGGEVSGLLACLVRRGGQKLSEEIVQALKEKVEGPV